PGVSTIHYDKYGRKHDHTDPDLDTETYDLYDSLDELKQFTDGRATQHKFDYDALGRMTQSQNILSGHTTPPETTNWDYDGIPGDFRPNEIGRLVRVRFSTDADTDRHVTRYGYQPTGFGLLGSVERSIASQAFTFSTGFSYDNFLRVETV